MPLNNLILHYLLTEGALAWISPALAQGRPRRSSPSSCSSAPSPRRRRSSRWRSSASRPALYTTLGVFLPLIAVNCVILAGSLFMQERDYTFGESVVYGVGLGAGLGDRDRRDGRRSARRWSTPTCRDGLQRPRHHLHHGGADVDRLHDVLRHPALTGHGTAMNEIITGIAMFTGVILLLVALLLAAQAQARRARRRHDPDQRRPGKALKVAGRRHAARHAGRQQDLHPLGLRRQGRLRRLRGRSSRKAAATCCRPRPATSRRGEAKRGCRLACQVKVKRDMKIEIAPEIFDVRKWKCRSSPTATSPPSSRS